MLSYIIFLVAIYIIFTILNGLRTKINASEIFSKAGVKIYTSNDIKIKPWDIIIHNNKAREDYMSGILGFVERYMKGYW